MIERSMELNTTTIVCTLLFHFSIPLLLSGCCQPGSPGTILDAETDSSFVAADIELYMYCGDFGMDGLCRVSLDGSSHQPIFDPAYYPKDITDDGEYFLLGDDETNLFVARSDGTDIRRIEQLNRRASDAGFSPDGTLIAAVRHSDFDKPQIQWTDDDAVYLIDVATLAVTTFPKASNRMVTSLQWTATGTAVQLDMFDGPSQMVSMNNGRRSPVLVNPSNLRARPTRTGEQYCAATGDQLVASEWGGDNGLVLVDATGNERDLVVVQGRERRGHDYQPTVDNFFLTPACDYAVFEFDGSVWVVETATGKTGPIRQGREPFLAP